MSPGAARGTSDREEVDRSVSTMSSTKVIMPGPGDELGKIQANELLPGKDAPR